VLGAIVKSTFIFLLCSVVFGCASYSDDFFPESAELSSFERDWYSEHLSAAKESPLLSMERGEVFRFTWLRSFHKPIIVRVFCKDVCSVESKVLSGAGGYSPGKIEDTNEYDLTLEQTSKLRSLFEKVDGWKYEPDAEIIVMDGAQWIFEHASVESYQLWDLSSPIGSKAAENYVDLGLYFLELSQFEIEANYVY
jgi:hypothetical protein